MDRRASERRKFGYYNLGMIRYVMFYSPAIVWVFMGIYSKGWVAVVSYIMASLVFVSVTILFLMKPKYASFETVSAIVKEEYGVDMVEAGDNLEEYIKRLETNDSTRQRGLNALKTRKIEQRR